MYTILAKYISVFLLSGVKFIAGPITGFAMKLSILETIVTTSLGMTTSVILVVFLGETFKKWFPKKDTFVKITPMKRKIVMIWGRFGITGVAFLTPILLSPIIGTLVAVNFGIKPFKIIVFMSISAWVWATLITFFIYELKAYFVSLF